MAMRSLLAQAALLSHAPQIFIVVAAADVVEDSTRLTCEARYAAVMLESSQAACVFGSYIATRARETNARAGFAHESAEAAKWQQRGERWEAR